MSDALARLTEALADRYAIERELGRGGMAMVYLAQDLKHRRQVALKVMRPELAAVLGADRFLAEIRITARLDHPHILTLIDSGEAGGLLYYVLPYVHGESLRVKLQREQQLGLDEALRIVRQVAGALEYAHRQGVIHRDIKPENILLFEGEAMLTDFGIALALRAAGGSRLTESGLSLGTPQYMSPEQATGDRTLDARSDVYSLGAVLYEMLAGEPPVTGPTVQAVIAKLLTERPVRLRAVRDTVPERLDAAVARALAKVPADRFASAADFATALATAEPEPLTAARRTRWLVPLAAVIVVAGAALAWAVLRARPAAAPIELERVQITFTGNATLPALSHDGRRVAYAVRQCAADGRCVEDIVVQDVGGAGAATVVRGAASVYEILWTPDGRYLVFDAAFGTDRWGVFSVPSLGGEPLFLGCCFGHMVPGGDTVLVTGPPARGDSLRWLRWITAADGVTHDSLGIPLVGAYDLMAYAFPDGRRLMLGTAGQGTIAVQVTDRTGRRLDSRSLGGYTPFQYDITADLSPDGRAILAALPRRSAPGQFDILSYRVARDGRIARRPDTLLRQLPALAGVSFAPNGMLAYAGGQEEHPLWAVRRESPASMRFEERLLLSATGVIDGRISPDGERVLLIRGTTGGERLLAQLSLMPFEGGPERQLGPPQDVVDADWLPDGTGVLLGVRRGADSVSVVRLDVATGRTAPAAAFAARDYRSLRPVPGGGLLVLSPSARDLRRVGVPGLADTTFQPPPGMWHFLHFDPSPDGRAFVSAAWTATWDTIVVHRVELSDGRTTRLASFREVQGVYGARWQADGSILVQILETAWTLAWYRVPAAGGPVVRLGAVPRFPGRYYIAADGRRMLARIDNFHSDVYLVPGFAELLKR